MPNDLKNKLNRFYDTYNDNRCSGLCQDLLRRRQIRQRINVVHYPRHRRATAPEPPPDGVRGALLNKSDLDKSAPRR